MTDQTNPGEFSEDEILGKEAEVKEMAKMMATMRKEMAVRKRQMAIDKREINKLRKQENACRKSLWQLILNNSKGQKDIALDGISGGLNQN
ncbi:MAG TPA: hypothetical protein VGQ53_08620 [Chitinophagaceae bacterium]|jgi:hypothetical protein|nr:hypothetical protein [Chitinophagaceae bacterium]